MNKIYLLILIFAMCFQFGLSQTVPQGMNYQAVARDKAGDVLSEENISIKIMLFSNSKIITEHYTEIHNIQTNKLGLFSLVIGEGDVYDGEFNNIPWSSEEIWMDVFVQYGGIPGFAKITSSKLYAVPYAFVAGQLAEENTASNRFKITNCPCHVGLVTLQILYLGPTATIKAYADANLNKLIYTYATVNYKDIISLDGSTNLPSGALADITYMEVITGSGTAVTMMNTKCTDYDQDLNNPVAGETFGNFSILSHTDKNGSICTACDMKPDWKVGGNALFDNIDCNTIGTLSNTDFVIITNDEERMRIYNDGDVNISNSLAVGIDLHVGNNAEICNDLTVKQSVNLNTLGGATTNYGPFTVGQISPSHLTGTLRVDKLTDLNDGLNVNNKSFTHLTGKLQVDEETDLYNDLTVHSSSPTKLTGILDVDSIATFRNRVRLPDSTFNTLHYTEGALVVAGGTGIGRNLHVGGDVKISGTTELNGPLFITDTHNSAVKTDTFALNVTNGGALIGQDLLVCDETKIGGTLDVTGVTSLSSTLNVDGVSNLKNALNVTGVTTLNDELNANGQVIITGPSSYLGLDTDFNSYPLQVQGGTQGIAIKVEQGRNNSTNFITFWDNTRNASWGRIEGETPGEFTNNADYNREKTSLEAAVAFSVLEVIFGGIEIAYKTADIIASASSVTGCAGLGVCVTSPIISLIVNSTAQLIVAIAHELVIVADLAVTSVNLGTFNSDKNTLQGVTYASGSGDYAEYLLKNDPDEFMSFGDIVGVKGGKVSKNINDAERMMVVSRKPIVLGNMPELGTEKEYEKIAFMGQVPVKVFGKVNIGDYIIPGGDNNGIGIAVSKSKISAKEIKKIVGIAWSSSDEKYGLSMINVAVGLNVNDNSHVVEDLESQISTQAGELNDLRKQIAETNKLLTQLIPGFNAPSSSFAVNSQTKQTSPSSNNNSNPSESQFHSTDDREIVYHQITRHEIMHAIDEAEKIMRNAGINIEEHVFWKKVKSDSAYKEEVIKKVEAKYDEAVEKHKKLNKQSR